MAPPYGRLLDSTFGMLTQMTGPVIWVNISQSANSNSSREVKMARYDPYGHRYTTTIRDILNDIGAYYLPLSPGPRQRRVLRYEIDELAGLPHPRTGVYPDRFRIDTIMTAGRGAAISRWYTRDDSVFAVLDQFLPGLRRWAARARMRVRPRQQARLQSSPAGFVSDAPARLIDAVRGLPQATLGVGDNPAGRKF